MAGTGHFPENAREHAKLWGLFRLG
jgi:hypothetical protein